MSESLYLQKGEMFCQIKRINNTFPEYTSELLGARFAYIFELLKKISLP